jgi:hypothetical protein
MGTRHPDGNWNTVLPLVVATATRRRASRHRQRSEEEDHASRSTRRLHCTGDRTSQPPDSPARPRRSRSARSAGAWRSNMTTCARSDSDSLSTARRTPWETACRRCHFGMHRDGRREIDGGGRSREAGGRWPGCRVFASEAAGCCKHGDVNDCIRCRKVLI